VTGAHFLWTFAIFAAGFLLKRERPAARSASLLEPARTWQISLACAVLVATFLAELVVVRVAAETQQPMPAWFARLPLLIIDETPPLNGHTPAWVGNDFALLVIGQSVVLYVLYRCLRNRTLALGSSAVIATSCGIMLAAALLTKATIAGQDLYLYVGYGHLGLGAYRPPHVPFDSDFAAINQLWGTPVLPAVYGPLWLFLASLVSTITHTLVAQLAAFRFLGALSLLVCVRLLWVIRTPPAAIALFALNPALIMQYVVDAHNDAIPLVFALCAIAIARRNPWLALICAVAAGAMKLPFVLASALAFSQLEARKKRVGFALATIVVSVGITAVLSDGAYFSALQYPLRYQALPLLSDRLAHLLAIVGALVATGLAIWVPRFIPTGAWAFLGLGINVLPQYVAWGVPYAVLEETFLPIYLFTLPVLAFDLSTTFGITVFMRLIFLAVICTPLILVLTRRRIGAVNAAEF
jgi:hypothetical protein